MEGFLQSRTSCVRRHIRQLGAIYLAILFCGLVGQGVRADLYLGPPEIIQLLSEQLIEGRKPMYDELASLGFSAEVDALQKQTSDALNHLSAQSVIKSLYHMAEFASAGEGDRFIGILLSEQVKKSGALANDPDISSYLEMFTADQLNLRRQPIKFASAASIPNMPQEPLKPVVERGIKILSEVYAHQGLAQLRVAALRTFRRSGFDTDTFDRAVLESPDPKEALRRIIARGTPQPTVEVALHKLLGEAVGRNAALGMEPVTIQIMEELSRDLPQEQKRYVDVESQLASRKAQILQARTPEAPVAVPRSNHEVAIDAMQPRPIGQAVPPPWEFSSRDIVSFELQKKSYEKYINDTFEPRKAEPALSTEPLPGTPGVPSFEPKTERKYTKARFSARAGRGVSVGGEVKVEIGEAPVQAVWLSNAEDNRFGRLFITFTPSSSGKPVVAASRVLFADSFFSAGTILSTPGDQPSAYRQDEILVLMSMNPSSSIWLEASRKANEKQQEFLSAAHKKLDAAEQQKLNQLLINIRSVTPYLTSGNQRDIDRQQVESFLKLGISRLDQRYVQEAESYLKEYGGLRGIVIHPALFGRELAWSTVRIDFWSNRIPLLEEESMEMNGGKSFPGELKSIDAGDSKTWQYYERGSVISMREANGRAHEIAVTSGSEDVGNTSERSHFSVAMFSPSSGRKAIKVEDGLFRRPDIEERFQPLLDWLATNHHDYMRLNDFSESFSLLRWLHSENIPLTVIEVGPQAKPIVIPDRVNVETGPAIDPKQGEH